jgi:hypothetical protein
MSNLFPRNFRCSFCGAKRGEPCRHYSGRLTSPHHARIYAARCALARLANARQLHFGDTPQDETAQGE